MRLEDITPSLVNTAIDIYLAHAYEDAVLRESHRVTFDESASMGAVLEHFEREEAKLASYSLRLGCEHYPHMKLAMWEAYFHNEYVFAVDRHDGFDFHHVGEDYEAWLGVKSRNFQVKTAIETAWYEAGVPTLRKVKEDRLSQSDVLREFSGHSLLLVDNDADAVAVLEMILSHAGYRCVCADSMVEVQAILEDDEQAARCGMALIDLMLSDGSGMDVVKMIRACPATQDIPILVTSAMNRSDVLLRTADGYLRKPFSADHLVEVVGQTLRRRYDGHEKLVDELKDEADADA